VTFVYEPDTSGTHQINASIDPGYVPDDTHDPSTITNVTMTVTVTANNGSGGGDDTFNVDWKDPSAGGVSFDSQTGRYDYNASKSGPLELTTVTDPSLDGAQIDYAVTNRSRATLSTYSGQTDSDGTHQTRIQAKAEGNVTLYTYSGGDADKLKFNITDAGSALTRASTVVYQDRSSDEVTVLEGDGGETQLPGPRDVDALGPAGSVLSSDDTPALPYIDGGSLKITDTFGNTETFVDSSDAAAPKTDKTGMATGTWQGTVESVFYAGSSASTLYRADAGGSTETIATPGDGVGSVVDTGDIDGDSETELVFVDGSQQVRYLNQDGTVDKLDNAGVGSNNGLGAGTVVELDGKTWALIVDGSQDIALVTDDGGNQKQVVSTSPSAVKAPLTAADVDEDGDTEIVYVSSSKKLQYVDNPLRSNVTTEQLTDSDGTNVKVTEELGAVSS
jgi:hypothetical protein